MDDKAKLEEVYGAYKEWIGAEKAKQKWMNALGPAAKYLLAPLIATAGAALLAFVAWAQIQVSSDDGEVPLGAVVAWPIEFDVPDGWCVCNGALVDAHEDLRRRLQGFYNNKETKAGKIQLPDFQGYFLRGSGMVDGDPQRASASIGTPQPAALSPTHMSWSTHWKVGLGSAVLFPRASQRHMGKDADLQAFVEAVPKDASEHREITPERDSRPANFAVKWIMRVK
jgi:hypothetical protein